MAEETVEQENVDVNGVAAAAPENTEEAPVAPEQEQEHMIPKSRFDEINNRYKETREELDKLRSLEKEAQRKAQEEQGEFQTLYEQLKEELEEQKRENQRIVLDAMRKDIAQRHGYGFLWDRLRGETEEELLEDLQGLIKELPAPNAPPVNGAAASGERTPRKEPMSLAQKQQYAAKYSIPVAHVPDFID